MPDELDEELAIMEERANELDKKLDFTISINEPIEKLVYKEPVIVSKDAKVIDAIRLFNEKDVGCVLIVENKKLIGIFTERDVIRKLIVNHLDIKKETIEKHMTKNPDSLFLSDPIPYALNRMSAGGYRHVPLVNKNNYPVGVISIRDIVEHLANYYPNEILNIPPSPHRKQKRPECE